MQAFPHAPQFAWSPCKLTQLFPQRVVPLVQLHEPPMHVVPPVHEMPQPPQLLGLRVTSTQLPAHRVVAAGHVV